MRPVSESNPRPRFLRRVLPGIALGICLSASPAETATTCLAVFVGNNAGLEREAPLRYAASDARKVSELFRSSSAFPRTEITVLENQGAARLRAELDRIRGRAAALKRDGGTVVLLFFYSGHGSAQSLHLSGGEFPRSEFHGLYAAGEFDVRILILDACESGDFLRQKGEASGPTHDFSAGDVEARGTMVLSSTARGELAQESEEYGEGVFSHHLLNALRGLGDFNGDSRVSVLEAFEYAQASTRGERIVGRTEMQNPGFDIDVVGRNDIALIDLAARKSLLVLEDFPFGDAEIYDAYSSRLVGKVKLTGKKKIPFLLRPGNYFLSFRRDGQAGYCSFSVPSGRPCRVKASEARNVAAEGGRNKGGLPIPFRPHILLGSARWSDPVGEGGMPVAGLEYVRCLSRRAEWGVSLGFGRGPGAGPRSLLETENRFFVLETELLSPLWQARRLGLWCGIGGGALFLDQRIRDKRLFAGPVETEEGALSPERSYRTAVLRARIPVSLRFRLHPRMFVAAEADGTLHRYRRAGREEPAVQAGWEQGLSMGVQF